MSQQINLFELGLVKSKDWFTLSFVAGVYVLAAMAMVYLYSGLEAESAQFLTQRDQAVAQQEAMQKRVDEFTQRLVPVDNSKLESELKNLKAQFEVQSQILAIFQQSISEQAYHLIDYMRALAGQQQPGLWLTGFKIEPAAQHVSLSGQALQTEDIPLYLDLLSAQRVFEGTQFSGLQFKQVELQKTVSQPAETVATQAAPVSAAEQPVAGKGTFAAPVATPLATTAATTAQTAVTDAPAKLRIYAFDVKGRDLSDKNKPASAVSWDEFVRQTIRQPQTNEAQASPAPASQTQVKQP
jgi:hypothetical protein